MHKQKPSIQEAIIKARTFCNYRDRCHKELRDKLYGMGLWKKEVEEVILQMMEEDLLNEERYARSFVRGYFRTKRWGRYKIRMELRQRQIHERLIDKAMEEIDPTEYDQAIQHLIEKKDGQFKGEKQHIRKGKISNYLMGRGYQYGEFKAMLDARFTDSTR